VQRTQEDFDSLLTYCKDKNLVFFLTLSDLDRREFEWQISVTPRDWVAGSAEGTRVIANILGVLPADSEFLNAFSREVLDVLGNCQGEVVLFGTKSDAGDPVFDRTTFAD